LNANVPAAFSELIERLLSKSPIRRPPSADAVATELAIISQSLGDGNDATLTMPVANPENRSPNRSRWVLPGIGIATAAILVAGVVYAVSLGRVTLPTSESHAVDGSPTVATQDNVLPLDGSLDAHIWTLEPDTQKRGLNVKTNPKALPVREGEALQLHVNLNRPAHVYLIWVDAAGVVTPLYPWNDNDEGRIVHDSISALLPNQDPRREVTSPRSVGSGWLFDNTSGLDTIIMLARSEPLPPGYALADQFDQLPAAPLDPTNLTEVVFRGWQEGKEVRRWQQVRAPQKQAAKIDSQLNELTDRLKPDFELIRTIQFAHVPNDTR